MKKNAIIFNLQCLVVAALACIGIIAVLGEPSPEANYTAVVAGQVITAAVSFTLTYKLCKRWQIIRKLDALQK